MSFVEIHKTIVRRIFHDDSKGRLKISDVPKGFHVDTVDDGGILGFCECCEQVIYETEGYYNGGEGCVLCIPCGDEIKNSEPIQPQMK